jgi:hypothetical protein
MGRGERRRKLTRKPDYKFNIVNMEKPTSEFNRGMRPLMYSEKEAALTGAGWLRCARDICYYPNQYARKSDPARTFHTLTFTVQFTNAGDTCYFAVSYPYTVSMWKRHLAYLVDGKYLFFCLPSHLYLLVYVLFHKDIWTEYFTHHYAKRLQEILATC